MSLIRIVRLAPPLPPSALTLRLRIKSAHLAFLRALRDFRLLPLRKERLELVQLAARDPVIGGELDVKGDDESTFLEGVPVDRHALVFNALHFSVTNHLAWIARENKT